MAASQHSEACNEIASSEKMSKILLYLICGNQDKAIIGI